MARENALKIGNLIKIGIKKRSGGDIIVKWMLSQKVLHVLGVLCNTMIKIALKCIGRTEMETDFVAVNVPGMQQDVYIL